MRRTTALAAVTMLLAGCGTTPSESSTEVADPASVVADESIALLNSLGQAIARAHHFPDPSVSQAEASATAKQLAPFAVQLRSIAGRAGALADRPGIGEVVATLPLALESQASGAAEIVEMTIAAIERADGPSWPVRAYCDPLTVIADYREQTDLDLAALRAATSAVLGGSDPTTSDAGYSRNLSGVVEDLHRCMLAAYANQANADLPTRERFDAALRDGLGRFSDVRDISVRLRRLVDGRTAPEVIAAWDALDAFIAAAMAGYQSELDQRGTEDAGAAYSRAANALNDALETMRASSFQSE